MIDRPPLLPLILDQRVFPIEEKNMKLLDLAVCDLCVAIVDQFVPLRSSPVDFGVSSDRD
jgi:hypothetical protein